MRTAFGILKDDPQVALAIWFCTQDFPGKNYGLYKMGSFQCARQAGLGNICERYTVGTWEWGALYVLPNEGKPAILCLAEHLNCII